VAKRLAFGYGLVAAVLTGVYFAVPAWHLVTWSLFGVLTCAAIVVGVVVHRPRRVLPWALWAGGSVFFAVGTVTALVLSEVLQRTAFPSWADVVYLAACFPCLLAALVTLTRSKATTADRAGLVDALILTTGAGFLSWVLVVNPYLQAPGLTVLQRAVSVAYPVCDVLILAILARFMTGAVRGWSATLLLLSGAGLFVADVLYGLVQLGSVEWHLGSPVDLGWILFFVGGGAAALHPSMRRLTEPRLVRAGDAAARRLALGTASLVAPGVLLGQALAGDVRDGVVIAVVSALLVALAMTRMSYVASGLRQTLARERELRRACEKLLSATDVETVTAAVHEAIGRLLPRGTAHSVRLALRDGALCGSPLVVEKTRNLPADLAPGLAGHDLTLHCRLSVGDRHVGRLYVAAGEKALVDLQQAVPVLAGQAASMIGHIELNREINRRHSEAYFRTLILNAADLILIVDDEGRIRYGSPSAAGLLGTDDVTGRPVRDLFVPEQRDAASAALEAVRLGTTIDSAGDWTVLRPTGGPAEVEVSIRDLRHEPSVNGTVLTLRDVTDRRRLQHELERRAYVDPLTGLGSRLLFQDEVQRAAAAPTVTGVLLVDLDDFRTVNETFGHEPADELLRAVGARLVSAVADARTVARLGADEFGVLVEGATDAVQIDRLVAGLLDRFTTPFVILGSTLTVRVSVGVATTADTDDPGQLLSRAGVALRTAKAAGKGRWRRYEAALHREILDRAQLRTELEHAIAADQLVLYYQPIVELDTGRAAGFESLVRWQHPERGLLPPGAFIDLAEESGLIGALGARVLERAVREAVGWQETLPEPPYVSVNVSARQFRTPGFVEHVLTLISRYGLAPHLLTLEITESLLLADPEQVREDLSILRSAGIRVSIDDFGTGYSSLSYLHQVPADVLKLDKSFVDTMSVSIRQYDLVAGIVHLARTLRLDVVAEGIETTTERTLLSGTGCAYGQGYLIAKPMPAEEVVPWLTGADVPVPA
jgi:diguanylate cyclase (GGDEF)-like protein/PAS domain S-box-containing protein